MLNLIEYKGNVENNIMDIWPLFFPQNDNFQQPSYLTLNPMNNKCTSIFLKLAILNITAGGMSGGYRKYLENLLPRISSNPTIEKILCTLPFSVSLNMISENCQNINIINIAPYQLTNSKSYSQIRILLDKFQPDVVYVPVERLISYENAPVVTMLQNMEPFIYPFSGNPFTDKIKNYCRFRNA